MIDYSGITEPEDRLGLFICNKDRIDHNLPEIHYLTALDENGIQHYKKLAKDILNFVWQEML